MTRFLHYIYYAAFDRDYHEVCQSLRNLRRRGDLIALGMMLGLSSQTVLGMGNGDDFLSQIIASWLNRQDNVLSQSGEPTWSVLADKLEEIGCSDIATDIRRDHDGSQPKSCESEGQNGNPPTLSVDLDPTTAPTSLFQPEPVTQSKQQGQPHTG